MKEDIQNCWKQASDVALKNISEEEQSTLVGILEKIENNIALELD